MLLKRSLATWLLAAAALAPLQPAQAEMRPRGLTPIEIPRAELVRATGGIFNPEHWMVFEQGEGGGSHGLSHIKLYNAELNQLVKVSTYKQPPAFDDVVAGNKALAQASAWEVRFQAMQEAGERRIFRVDYLDGFSRQHDMINVAYLIKHASGLYRVDYMLPQTRYRTSQFDADILRFDGGAD